VEQSPNKGIHRFWYFPVLSLALSARLPRYMSLDIAALSVDQARGRWDSLPRASRFDATFTALDCYSEPLIHGILPARLAEPFDVVSMQFCMHYAFESEAKAHCMLRNVTQWLRPGGIFLGTIPNAEQLLTRLDQMPADAPGLSFGNSVYSIKFESREPRPLYGHRYSFFLQDAVEDVPEYLVHWEHFAQCVHTPSLNVSTHTLTHFQISRQI
jgi:mRNA (guanine-N7-)-methyltransferase